MHLFPSIQPPKKKVLKDMRLQVSVGQFSEGNLSEAKVSILQCRAALKQPLDLYNIREIDASLGKTLETIYASHQAWLRSEGAQPWRWTACASRTCASHLSCQVRGMATIAKKTHSCLNPCSCLPDLAGRVYVDTCEYPLMTYWASAVSPAQFDKVHIFSKLQGRSMYN